MTATELLVTGQDSKRGRRSRKTYGGGKPNAFLKPRTSPLLTILMALMLMYTVVPLLWMVINSTKTQSALMSTFGLWFADPFALWDNIVKTLTYNDGVFLTWLLNTFLYTVVGAGGATLLATFAGYALARFEFKGKGAVFAVVLGAIAIPGTALAVPTFLFFSTIGITNNPLAVILPSLVSPFGLYLVWTYARDSIPRELLEAARMDGAGELRIFFQIALRLLMPGVTTVMLFNIVETWNNYFLPLIMLSDPKWYPLTVGLNMWSTQANQPGGVPIYELIVTGSVLTLIPIVVVFLLMQRYWQAGLAAGGVKG